MNSWLSPIKQIQVLEKTYRCQNRGRYCGGPGRCGGQRGGRSTLVLDDGGPRLYPMVVLATSLDNFLGAWASPLDNATAQRPTTTCKMVSTTANDTAGRRDSGVGCGRRAGRAPARAVPLANLFPLSMDCRSNHPGLKV